MLGTPVLARPTGVRTCAWARGATCDLSDEGRAWPVGEE